MMIQTLVYLVLVPPQLPPGCPSPIDLLGKIRSYHTPELHRGDCLPTYPRTRDAPRWAGWDAESPPEKLIKRYISQATEEGIWGLLWESRFTKPASAAEKDGRGDLRKRARTRRVGEEDEEEDDDDEKEEKKVSDRGWVLLEWLVSYWFEDQSKPCSLLSFAYSLLGCMIGMFDAGNGIRG